jgi:hypothetical protein
MSPVPPLMHSTGVHSINAMPDNASIHHNIDQATIDRWFIEHRFTDFASRFNIDCSRPLNT